MKKRAAILSLIFLLLLTGCGANIPAVPETFESPESVADFLLERNRAYAAAKTNGGDISAAVRKETSENGQSPYAVVVTCSDSRVPPEHIFSAGIGELFVIRTAGNVIGPYELGSVAYGAEHLHSKLVLVLGHTGCGAVDAAINGGAHGNIEHITNEISACLPENCSAREAEILNVENSISRILESEIMQELQADGSVAVMGAIYDISTGTVTLLEP